MSDSGRREYAQWILSRGGGMVTTGNHLGVFVSAVENLPRCPTGWIFVDINDTDVDRLCEAIEQANTGRKLWPKDSKKDGTTATE